LSIAYAIECDNFLYTTEGKLGMSKEFFPMFKRAWDQAFAEEPIKTLSENQEFGLLM
jgi:hypothetical protein